MEANETQRTVGVGLDAQRQYSREEFCQVMGIARRTWERWLHRVHRQSGVPFRAIVTYPMGQPRIFGADFIAWSRGERRAEKNLAS